LTKLKSIDHGCNYILGGDFNTTTSKKEKQGGLIVRDTFQENMEDLILNLNLFAVKNPKFLYTWNNKCTCLAHIAARLDHFLALDSLLILNLYLKLFILSLCGLDHCPISVLISSSLNLGPIPFQFSPLWLESLGFFNLVSLSWSEWVEGCSLSIWE